MIELKRFWSSRSSNDDISLFESCVKRFSELTSVFYCSQNSGGRISARAVPAGTETSQICEPQPFLRTLQKSPLNRGLEVSPNRVESQISTPLPLEVIPVSSLSGENFFGRASEPFRTTSVKIQLKAGLSSGSTKTSSRSALRRMQRDCSLFLYESGALGSRPHRTAPSKSCYSPSPSVNNLFWKVDRIRARSP